MHILHAIGEMGTGGAESLVAELVRRGPEVGWRSSVASAGGVREDEIVRAGLAPVHRVPLSRRRPDGLARAVAATRRALRAAQPDVVLRGFADRGGTVLLSSHLLHEVEAVADQLVVIAGGRIVARGSKAELLTASGTVVRATDPAALEGALTSAGIAVSPGLAGALVADAEPEAVGRAAAATGVVLVELRPADGGGLEELFRSLTGTADTPPAGTVPAAQQVQEARA